MTEFEVNCKKWNNEKDQVITHLGVDGKLYSIKTIIYNIKFVGNKFYTWVNNEKAYVKVIQLSNGSEYLRTDKDTTTVNNLDNLPNCNKS